MIDFGTGEAVAQQSLFEEEVPPNNRPAIMPFGKYQGVALAAIDAGYLRWALANMNKLSPSLRRAMEVELAGRKATPGRQALPIVSAAAPAQEMPSPIEGDGLGPSIDRAKQSLDWLAERTTDLRRRLDTGVWEEGRPLDLQLVAATSGAVTASTVLIDPERIAEKAAAKRGAEPDSTDNPRARPP
jgi:hypothetical protein